MNTQPVEYIQTISFRFTKLEVNFMNPTLIIVSPKNQRKYRVEIITPNTLRFINIKGANITGIAQDLRDHKAAASNYTFTPLDYTLAIPKKNDNPTSFKITGGIPDIVDACCTRKWISLKDKTLIQREAVKLRINQKLEKDEQELHDKLLQTPPKQLTPVFK